MIFPYFPIKNLHLIGIFDGYVSHNHEGNQPWPGVVSQIIAQ